ncbi:MAG: hypothetical protein ACHP7N_00255 [Caulobacterales bacterium]
MSVPHQQPFWRGPIATATQARKIVRTTGWVFAGLALVWLALQATTGLLITNSFATVVTVAFVAIVAAAAFLIRGQSPAAALLLFCASAAVELFLISPGIAFPYFFDGQLRPSLFLPALCWSPSIYLCWRARRAATMLRVLEVRGDHWQTAQVFD